MRYDLTDFECSVSNRLLPMKRGPKPNNTRRRINGMFSILRTGCPWRDLPERYGRHTTGYNCFNRWRKTGIWDPLMDAIVKAHGRQGAMVDSSLVRVH
jgi:transposase